MSTPNSNSDKRINDSGDTLPCNKRLLAKLHKTAAIMSKKGIKTVQNCTFSHLTTIGTGGNISLTLYPTSVSLLVFATRYLLRHRIPHCFLGNGSNVLASDDDYNGVVVVTTQVKQLSVHGNVVVATCGVTTSKLCAELVQNGLAGGEFFGCLPATVGGATVCNAGCFGQCVSQVVQSVTALYRGRLRTLSRKQCCFDKRNSIFKNNNDYLVLQVEMKFHTDSPKQIQLRLADMRKKKSDTQPLGYRSAGSVLFSKQVPVSRFIDQAGLKGFRLGGAQVSEKHAGFVINLDKASSKDIYLLVQYIQDTLKHRYGIMSEVELCLINFS